MLSVRVSGSLKLRVEPKIRTFPYWEDFGARQRTIPASISLYLSSSVCPRLPSLLLVDNTDARGQELSRELQGITGCVLKEIMSSLGF